MNKNFFHKINNDLFVFAAGNFEDFRSVWGAKTSRTIMLEFKEGMDEVEVNRFLETNIKNYNHASIGDMGFASVFHRGFGWLTARVLMDDPLFNGQETSTRVVNILNFFPESCYDAGSEFKSSHEKFKRIFNELTLTLNPKAKGYILDDIRWALPGTLQNGVTIAMNIRSFARRLDYINNDFTKTAEQYLAGLKYCAPNLTNALYGKTRLTPSRYTQVKVFNIKNLFDKYEDMISITSPVGWNPFNIDLSFFDKREENTKNMLDSRLNRIGLFKIEISCSIAEARDWFRHRTAQPWDMFVLTINNKPFINNFFHTLDLYKAEVEQYMEEYKLDNVNHFSKLYGLPYGTMLRISAFVPLNYLVYMLELRSKAVGANIEYATKAKEGLRQLNDILGSEVSNYFSIL